MFLLKSDREQLQTQLNYQRTRANNARKALQRSDASWATPALVKEMNLALQDALANIAAIEKRLNH